jgi:hypothetical protein
MDKKIKRFLKKMGKESSLNFKGLINLIKDNDIPIKESGISGPVGIAFHNKILVDILGLDYMGYEMTYFTILHEIGHYLRLQKQPKNRIINLYKSDDFKTFFDDVIYEELFADKFANLEYYRLNGCSINYYQFKFDSEYLIAQYGGKMKPLFNMVNSKKDYQNLVKQLTFSRHEKEFEGVI